MKIVECKFCHKYVLYDDDDLKRRVYELDGKTLHVDNCPKRRAHYKQRASDVTNKRRQARR